MISVIIALIIGILVGKITKFHEKILSPRKIKIILVDRGHDKKAYLEDNKGAGIMDQQKLMLLGVYF